MATMNIRTTAMRVVAKLPQTARQGVVRVQRVAPSTKQSVPQKDISLQSTILPGKVASLFSGARRSWAHSPSPERFVDPDQLITLFQSNAKYVINFHPTVLALGSINPFRMFLESQAAYFSTLNLPDWLVHWGHPGNMAVVLFAMGGYGAAYLGWQIKLSDDPDVIEKAKDAHPKLAAGMAIFFALGSLGGMMSLLMQ